MRFELLALLGLPIGPNVLGELRTGVQVCAGEIQNERPLDDGHFEHPQAVVVPEQLRHVETRTAFTPSS